MAQAASIVPGQPSGGVIPLDGVRLVDLAETARFRDLDRLESYYRCTQDDHKKYDWDGMFLGYGAEADIAPGWFVPYKRRKPSARYDLGKVIVNRLTSMLFGIDRFPELRVPGDEDAEDYVKALCAASRLPMRLAEARTLGGATGTVALSWGFVKGKPRVEVHNAKHCTVLRWADQSEGRVGAALKTYCYPRLVVENGKLVTKDFFYARYWDETQEIVWEPLTREQASSALWMNANRRTIPTAFGFTPFYWVQNIPDSQDVDGECDYDGTCETLDEINQVLSANGRGVKSNVDPTLVIKMDPANNDGTVKRGSDNVIWSTGGADYLEVKGQSNAAALSLVKELRAFVLDQASVILADPEKLSGAAQSAQALRILYAPMLAKCDVLREQYEVFAILPILGDMLRASKKLGSAPAVPATTKEGEQLLLTTKVTLPPRVIQEGEATKLVERKPGESEDIVCNWNPYFAPTWADIAQAVTAVTTANGKKPVISQETSIASVQSLFGVQDVQSELEKIQEQAEKDVEMAQKAMGPGPEAETEEQPPKKGEEPEE